MKKRNNCIFQVVGSIKIPKSKFQNLLKKVSRFLILFLTLPLPPTVDQMLKTTTRKLLILTIKNLTVPRKW